MFFDNQAYAEESTLATLWSALGGSNLPGLTYTPPTPETSASLSYVNGETKVEIGAIPQADNSTSIPEYSIGNDNIIKMKKTDGSFVPLHEYPLTSSKDRIDVLRVIIDVYEGEGMYLGTYLFMRPNPDKPAKVNPAYESERKIYINSNGPFNELLSHKYNLLNTLHHENLHRLDPDGKTESFLEHALVYFGQIRHPSFNNCLDDYKISSIGGMGERLLSHVVKSSTNYAENSVISTVSEFNELKNGFRLLLDFNHQKQENYTISVFQGEKNIGVIKFNPNLKKYEN